MTSLIRSLLALGVFALLHAASAQSHEKFPGPFRSDNPGQESNCATYMFGKRSDMVTHLPPMHTTETDNVYIYDPYAPPHTVGTVVIGEEITVCNRNRRGPAPQVSLSSPDSFDLVNLRVGFCVPPPVDIEMFVTRFRKVPGPEWYQHI